MKIAIIERIENFEEVKPFNKRYYLDNSFKKIFDELGILLFPIISENNLKEIVDICDGLVITGSPNDVHPKYYGEEPIIGKNYIFDEYNLVKNTAELFFNSKKPILGICAGIQEINVIFGGTLHQKISNHNLIDGSKHKIEIINNSFLYDVYKNNIIEVNSYHSQAIKDLAPNFKITAISEDGIIEGIERENVVAVQWHPELLYDMKIFKEFISRFINK